MRVYIETYGCQMNEYDSRMIASMLEAAGHSMVDDLTIAEAALVNTCSVRERAELRVIGRLNHLRGLIPQGAVLGVIGCAAQRMGETILKSAPGLDLVVGTDSYGRLPEILESCVRGEARVFVGVNDAETYDGRPEARESRVCEFVGVMRGCDNYCTYCIVPYVRGRERSRPAGNVVAEVESLVRLGTRDVTLIGQNVNSYRDAGVDFAGLIERVQAVDGLHRIRFATSHPKDLSDRLIRTIARGEKVCEHVHLPVQSGSDAVLAAMNRGYSRAHYLDLASRIRDSIPGVALTTDIIVGFPGETQSDYEETMALMNAVKFDSAFMFRYSVREGTRAAEMNDDVPEQVKIERLESVIALQKTITESVNARLAGSRMEVLVEGPSQRDEAMLFGRSRSGKAVVFPDDATPVGALRMVEIVKASAWTLHAVPSD